MMMMRTGLTRPQTESDEIQNERKITRDQRVFSHIFFLCSSTEKEGGIVAKTGEGRNERQQTINGYELKLDISGGREWEGYVMRCYARCDDGL